MLACGQASGVHSQGVCLSHGAILTSIAGLREMLPCWGSSELGCSVVFVSMLPAGAPDGQVCPARSWGARAAAPSSLLSRLTAPAHARAAPCTRPAAPDLHQVSEHYWCWRCRLFEEAMMGCGAAVGYKQAGPQSCCTPPGVMSCSAAYGVLRVVTWSVEQHRSVLQYCAPTGVCVPSMSRGSCSRTWPLYSQP